MGASPHALCRPALSCPPRSWISRVTRGTATICRIHQPRPVASIALSGISVPEDMLAKPPSETGCVARADAGPARRAQILAPCLDSRLAPVCSWRLCESPRVGKQGERERNMPLLSEAALHLHADLYFELLSLAGVTPRIARARLPKPARGTHSMSSPHATTVEKGRLTETSHPLGIELFQSPQPFSGVGGPNPARAPL